MKNDGKAFEELIKVSCEQYRSRGMAFIQKTPNPWVIIRRGSRVIDAKPDANHKMLDFVGLSHGRAIQFEAKSTVVTTRFDLKNIEEHQYEKLKMVHDQGGISFILVSFEKLYEIYLIPFPVLERYWIGYMGNGPKSIRYEAMRYECEEVRSGRQIFLDFLSNII